MVAIAVLDLPHVLMFQAHFSVLARPDTLAMV